MEGWGWQAVHDPALLPSVMERWTASIASGEPFEMVFPLRGADGRFRPFLTQANPTRDAGGAIVNWFGVNIDVSSQAKAQSELRESEATVAAFYETAGGFMAVVDLEDDDFRFVTANRRMSRFWGRDDVAGLSVRDLSGRPPERRVLKTLQKGFAAGERTTFEHPYESPDGEHWFLATLNPMPPGPSGRPRLAIASLDITDAARRFPRLLQRALV